MFLKSMKSVVYVMLPVILAWYTGNARSHAGKVYSQPFNSNGGQYLSSWWDPDGSDYDQYVWDDFTLQSTTQISEIDWIGAYDPLKFGSGGKVLDFTVAVYPSIAAGSQPDVVHNAIVEYHTGGSANETPADSFAGVRYYTYSFVLPNPFEAAADTKYWVQIEAWQHGIPDWGIASATGGDNAYFRKIANVGDIYYQTVPGDAALILVNQTVSTREGRAQNRQSERPLRSMFITVFRSSDAALSPEKVGWSYSVNDLLGRTVCGPSAVGLTRSIIGNRLSAGKFIVLPYER